MTITRDPETGKNHQKAEIKSPLIQTEKTSVSRYQSERIDNGSIWMVLLATLVAVSGSFEFGSCVGFSAPTESGIRADLGLSLSEYSLFGSILTIGAMVGAATSGRVADYIGRKGAMRMSAVFCIAGWLAIYFGKTAWLLDLGRLSGGYGIGILSYVVPVYIAEITPKNLRGGLTTVNQLMICSGASFAFILGTVLEWRMLALTGLIPCFFLLLGLFFIPESPRWLAKVGQEEEFEAALQQLRGKDANISEEATEIKDYIETLQSLPKAQIQDLFQRKYAHSVVVGVGLMVCQQFGGINGISFYLSETLVSAGFSSGNIGTIAWAIIQIPITAIGAFLLDKSGRRPLLMISATGTFMGLFLVGVAFFLKSYALLLEWIPILVLTGSLVYVGSFSMGMGGIPWLIMSEIFPINMKGIAGSLVTLVNWFTSWVISYAFNDLMRWSSAGTFFFFSAVCAMTIFFVKKLVPETKGRTLEQIQVSMNSFSKEIC